MRVTFFLVTQSTKTQQWHRQQQVQSQLSSETYLRTSLAPLVEFN
jgi:hypothetical protein